MVSHRGRCRSTPLPSDVSDLGVAGLTGFTTRRWDQLRILMQVAAVMLVLILVAVVRARQEFDTAKPLTWLFGVGFLATAIGIASLYARMEARAAG